VIFLGSGVHSDNFMGFFPSSFALFSLMIMQYLGTKNQGDEHFHAFVTFEYL
jgi:hypothetical protein